MLPAAPARAQQDALVPQSVVPPSPTEPPPGFAVAPNEARAAAERVEAVQAARREHSGLRSTVAVPTAGGDPRTYQVGYFTPLERSQYGSDIRVEVVVSGVSGEVLEVWTGPQAATPLARGGEPSLGRSLNKPWVRLPLAALFLLPFVDPRRPLRLVHLDLLVLLGFGISQLYFNQGRIEVSVPLVYPLLAYLLVRALLAGLRPRPRREALVPWLPMRWLAVGLVLLVAFRVGLNVQDSTVIDVGYASTVGADRIAHGEELYVQNEVHGDTYGPVNYLAYLPFEALLPWDGSWGAVPAAHAAAVAFDLLTIIGLMLLGSTSRRERPAGASASRSPSPGRPTRSRCSCSRRTPTTGWSPRCSCSRWWRCAPRPGARAAGARRGGEVRAARARPLLASGTGERRSRSWLAFTLAFCAVAWPPCCPSCPTAACVSCTTRRSASSSGAAPVQPLGAPPVARLAPAAAQGGAAALAVAVAFVPRRREPRQVGASRRR